MRLTAPLLVLLLCCATGPGEDAADKAGTIVGTVRFTGKTPPPERILTTDGGTLWHHDLLVDAKSKGLRFVLAVLENAAAQPKISADKSILMDQRDMVFLPRVLAIQHGQKIRFENNDLGNHSVQAVSLLPANQFNVIARPGQPVEHVFELQKRPVMIGCSIHAWMRAWIHIVPHPWFALTDAMGKFRIDKVPPGKYTLLLAHDDTKHQERREITVEPGQTVKLDVEWQKLETK